MLEYDNAVFHTNLWETFESDQQKWDPLIESKGKWKNHDYIAPSNYNIVHHQDVTLRDFHNYSQFLNSLRPKVLEGFELPVEFYIGFVNEKTLDKVEFEVSCKDLSEITLRVRTSKAVPYNKLKVSRDEYDHIDRNTNPPYNAITWEEKTVKSVLPVIKCYDLCKAAIARLRSSGFREIKQNENISSLLKKHEVYKHCIVNLNKVNENSFIHELGVYNADMDYIADDVQFDIPGTAHDIFNYKTFLDYILPSNMAKNNIKYPLDVYIPFASKRDGKIVSIWVSYPTNPKENKKNVKVTVFIAIPFIYRVNDVNKLKLDPVKWITNKRDIEDVANSDDLYIGWDSKRETVKGDSEKIYNMIYSIINKLLTNGFSIFKEDDSINIIQFVLEDPNAPVTRVPDMVTYSKVKKKVEGRGRPKGTTKKKLW